MKYAFQISPERTVEFNPKSPKRVAVGSGMVMVSAKVKGADGTVYDAVLELDESDNGRVFELHILLPLSSVSTADKGFTRKLRTTRQKFFPYTYNYQPVQLQCEDTHVDAETGWSQ